MKRLVTLLLFSFAFVGGSFAQKATSVGKLWTTGNLPQPLTTTIVTCGPLTMTITGTDPKCFGSSDGSVCVAVSGGVQPYTYSWNLGAYTTACVTGLTANSYLIEVWDSTTPIENYCTSSISLNPATILGINITPPTPVTNCFNSCDGSATANGTGGNAPYSYVWNTTPPQSTGPATGLCAQAYTVTVTDNNGCTGSKKVTIGQPALLVSNGSSTSITCFGANNGTATVNPSGGNPGYTYSWAPGGATTSAISNLTPGTYTCYISDTKTCTATYVTTINEPPVLAISSITGSNLVCNSVCTGSVTATATGGIGAYTYSWAPGGYTTSAVTGLCANTYTLTLKDVNNCTKTATITLTQPTAITSTITSTNVNCFNACDGTANVSASGGTPGYSYSWSTGASTSAVTGLCNQTYTVTTTDVNSCTNQNTVTLTQPPLLTVTPSKTNESCPGYCDGTMTATAGGGTPPYTYNWSSGCTTSACAGICSGTYSITVIDSKNCTATGTVAVGAPPAVILNLSSTAALCFGNCNGTATSNTTGGVPPYTYAWAPGGATTSAVSNLCAGNYTLVVTDASGCTMPGTISVTQPPVFTASIVSATPNPLNCNGDCNGTALASLNGGVLPYTYAWSNGGTAASITGLCAGGYTLSATDGNGCPASTSVTFTAPAVLNATLSVTNASCSFGCNGGITATAGGGTAPYSYSWLPGGQTTSAITGQCAGNYTITITDSKACTSTQTVSIAAPSAVAATFSVTNVSCSGACDGTATAMASGGTGAYTYTWAGGQTTSTATGFCAGLHNIIVQDANGCSSPLYGVNISQPAVLSAFMSSSVSSCGACTGSAGITAVGGTAPYSYSWAPGGQTTSTATGLCVGGYTVTVTDSHSCTTTVALAISSQINVVMNTSGPGVSCASSCNAAASANPSGGALPYTYSWSPSGQTSQTATGLCAGTYSVLITDAGGCTATRTVSFSAPAAVSSTVTGTAASCGVCNGSAAASAAGGTGSFTYSWSGFPVQTTATATGLCTGNYTVTIADANNCTTTNTVAIGNVPTISDNASITLSTCGSNDGAICVSPTGGSGAYTYSWAPGGETVSCVSDLVAGIYTVTITDAIGCSDVFPIGLGTVNGPTLTVTSSSDPICNASCDGAIAVSAAGNSPFTYSWSPGGETTTAISGLCAGNYIVQVTDNVPCVAFSSTTLTDPPQLQSNPTITNATCFSANDGSICLSPSGGTGPYTFNWLPGGQTTSCRAALTSGSYSVVVADATGCDDTLLIPVSAPALLTVSITATNVTCNGNANGTATAVVSGGTASYTYSWSNGGALPGIAGLSPATYSVLVTDGNGCTATASVTITQPAVLTSTISATNISCNSMCDGMATMNVSGGTTAYTYAWNPTSETTSAITGLCQGSYIATVTDANGCTSTASVSITEPTAITATVTPANATCAGGCDGAATANVVGGSGAYTYTWNPGALTGASVTGLCVGNYTLTTTDANGCSLNSAFTISGPSLIQANITTTITACSSTCDGMAMSSPVGGTGAYTFLWSNGETTSSITGLCAGTYTLTLSDASACSISQTFNVGSPIPMSQSSAIIGATCNLCNGSITAAGSGGTGPYSFFWSTGATTATITGLCAGIYIDTVMDSKGCISVDTLALSNTTGPSFTVNSTSVTCNGLCNGTAAISNETGNGPPWIYLWTFTPGNQTTQSVSGLCPNQYFASVTDVNGCTTIQAVPIIQPAVLADNSVVTNATCFGICNGSIVANPTGGTGAYTYSWSGGQTTSSIAAQCSGNYTLTLTDANGCSLTNTFTIGQNTILTSTLTSTNNACNAACNGSATITISGGTQPYSYAWTGGQTTTTATGLCANAYTITTTDNIGCVNITTVTITEPGPLLANVTAVNPSCTSMCNGNISSAPTGGTTPYTYSWSPGGLTTTAITGLCAGSYTLDISDANGCTSTTTVTLTDPPLLTATSTATAAACANTCDGSIDLSPAGGTPAYTFQWSPGGMSTEDVSGLCPGNYTVLITDANGCTFTHTVSIGITTLVVAVASNDTNFCAGGTATLTSTSTNATSINWYQIGSPAWTLVGSTTPINVSPAVGVTSYGLIAMNGVCSDTDTVIVTVNSFPVVVTNNTTICSGTTATVCASGATTYQWYQLPAGTPIATGSCITVSPAIGVSNYAVIGMNGTCSDSDTVSVTVLAMPVANAGPDTATCLGGSIQLCGTPLSLNGVVFNWFQLPSWTPGDTDTCTTVAPIVSTDYALIVSNGICSDTDTVSVTIYPGPTANAGSDVTMLSSASTVLTGSGNGSYLWTPSAGLSNTTIANPTANPSVTTTYTLLVTDTSGCTSVDSVKITIVTEVKPNDGLSPNGDGINDVWVIPNIEQFPNALVEVYNRWGELLFHSIGYKEKWDATYNGKELPVGTYYYVINLNSDLHPDPLTGPITILR